MTKTMNNRLGFTLVELLVVISIIAMLAALLLPAIQAAREQGRRVQCISNQNQVAFALLNYETTKQSFPALRAPLKPGSYPCYHFARASVANPDHTELTWVGFLLPFMEQNPAWVQINSRNIEDALFDLVIPVMQCKSSGIAAGDNYISYVVNAGPQNFRPENSLQEYGNEWRDRRDAPRYTLFFDHFALVGPWQGVPSPDRLDTLCTAKSTVDNIVSMDGTSMTILLSENVDADRWIWHLGNRIPIASYHEIPTGFSASDVLPIPPPPTGLTNIEDLVAFCFPNDFIENTAVGIDYWSPNYIPLVWPVDEITSPLFINEGGLNSGASITYRSRTARPSSGHPGVVVTAFCDRSVRPLKDDMDKTLFVHLCRPGSGVIINPKDLD